MGWFANRRARAARESGVEAFGAFCRAAGRDERAPMSPRQRRADRRRRSATMCAA